MTETSTEQHALALARIETRVRDDLKTALERLKAAGNPRQEARASDYTSTLTRTLALILAFRQNPHRNLHRQLRESGLGELRGYEMMLDALGREDEALFGRCDSYTIATIWVNAALREREGRQSATLHQMREDWRQFAQWWRKQKSALPKDDAILETLHERAVPRRTENIEVDGTLRRGWAGCAYSPQEGKKAAVDALMKRREGLRAIRDGTYPGKAPEGPASERGAQEERLAILRRKLRKAAEPGEQSIGMAGRAAINAVDEACRDAVIRVQAIRVQLSLAKAIGDGTDHGRRVLATAMEVLQNDGDAELRYPVLIENTIRATASAIEQGTTTVARFANKGKSPDAERRMADLEEALEVAREEAGRCRNVPATGGPQ